MAFYNPQKIEFNPNTGVIEAIGAVGKSLWDIYNTHLQNDQNQAKIDEGIRHNKSTEQHKADVLNETKTHHTWQREDSDKRFNADQEWKNKEFNFGIQKFNADQAFKAQQHADNMFYRNLALQDRIEARNNKALADEIALVHKIQAQDDEARALAEQYADNAYLAGHHKALNPDGTIDTDKLINAIMTNYKINPRSAVSGINKILSEKRGLDANLAQSQTLKNIATLSEQIAKIPDGKKIDDYDGWWDRAGDNINAFRGKGEDKKAVESILQLLTNSVYQMQKTNRGAEGERKDLDKEYKVTLDSVIFDKDKYAEGQKLQGAAIPAMMQELITKRDGANNTYTKQFYDNKIKALTEANEWLSAFFGAKPKANEGDTQKTQEEVKQKFIQKQQQSGVYLN